MRLKSVLSKLATPKTDSKPANGEGVSLIEKKEANSVLHQLWVLSRRIFLPSRNDNGKITANPGLDPASKVVT
jgi:hypothetical protein